MVDSSLNLGQIERAVRASFARDTCSEDDLPEWSEANASRGHCAVTALTLQDFLGGELLCAEVHRDGVRFGYHWWNLIAGIQVDLTRDQFSADEKVQEPWFVPRPSGDHLYAEQYEEFRTRVTRELS